MSIIFIVPVWTSRYALATNPYSEKYETLWKLRDGRTVLLRPIKPEDEPLWLEMFQSFSEDAIRNRFFEIIADTPHEMRVRYCNIDYDKEMAIVAELTEKGRRKMLGVVRLCIDTEKKTGELAFIVADPYQALGLGTKMIEHMVEICRDLGLKDIYALMLPDNLRAISLVKKLGFVVKHLEDSTVKATMNLKSDK